MSHSETLVRDTYERHPEYWEQAWKKESIRQLATIARQSLVSISPVQFTARFSLLGTAETRATSIVNESANVVEELLDTRSGFRALVAENLQAEGLKKPSATQLRNLLVPLVEESLRSIRSSVIVVSASEHDVYTELADILSKELHALSHSGNSISEVIALDYALLVYHLRRWKIPFDRLENSLTDLAKGPLGIRGTLISIQNRHRSSDNIDDFTPPVISFVAVTFNPSIKTLSEIFGIIESESNSIPQGSGFMHREMPVATSVAQELLAGSPIATQSLVEQGRRILYPQYEHMALIFMTLAGMEFLLRSSVTAYQAPDESMPKVIASNQALSSPLLEQLLGIYSSDKWNIRNRCMHGSFFEIEGRREDIIRNSGILGQHGIPIVDLSLDGSLPKNVSALTLDTLAKLVQQLESQSTQFSVTWTEHFTLTPDELNEARAIDCNIFESLESAEAWRTLIRDYVREVTPCFSTAIEWGVMRWVQSGTSEDAIPAFHFLALLLEPLLRLTLHAGAQTILQRSVESSGSVYRIQYAMLDSRGLLAPDKLAWLTDHLDAADKPIAVRILQLATKCRDAVAHGAIVQFSEEIRTIYGHMLARAVQLIVEAGRWHMQGIPS